MTSYQPSLSRTWPQKSEHPQKIQIGFSSTIWRFVSVPPAAWQSTQLQFCYSLGNFGRWTSTFFWAWHSLSMGKLFQSILSLSYLQKYCIKIFSTENTVSTLATCLQVSFFSILKRFMLPPENQKCSIPVSGWLDLNLRVSLN